MSEAQRLIEGEHFEWDDKLTFVALTEEVHFLVEDLMGKSVWPFVSKVATWQEGSANSGALIFDDNANLLRSDIINILEKNIR